MSCWCAWRLLYLQGSSKFLENNFHWTKQKEMTHEESKLRKQHKLIAVKDQERLLDKFWMSTTQNMHHRSEPQKKKRKQTIHLALKVWWNSFSLLHWDSFRKLSSFLWILCPTCCSALLLHSEMSGQSGSAFLPPLASPKSARAIPPVPPIQVAPPSTPNLRILSKPKSSPRSDLSLSILRLVVAFEFTWFSLLRRPVPPATPGRETQMQRRLRKTRYFCGGWLNSSHNALVLAAVTFLVILEVGNFVAWQHLVIKIYVAAPSFVIFSSVFILFVGCICSFHRFVELPSSIPSMFALLQRSCL